MNVFYQVMVLFLLLLCGFLAAKYKWISTEGFQGLNKFVMYFAIPSLTIMKLQVTADKALLIALMQTFLYATIAMLVLCGICLVLFRKQETKRKAVLTNLVTFSNCGFMGYPVVAARFGEDMIIYAVMFVTSFNLLTWTLGSIMFSGKKEIPWKSLVTNPGLIAVFVGMLLLLTQVRVPTPFSDTLTLLAQTTTPLSMIVIGSKLIELNLPMLKDKQLMLSVILRLVVAPLSLLGVLRLLSIPDPMAAILFLCYAMPSAALTAMQAEYHQCEAPLASAGVAISSALSMLTIPLMLLML